MSYLPSSGAWVVPDCPALPTETSEIRYRAPVAVFTNVSGLPIRSVVVLPPPEYAPPAMPTTTDLDSGFSATRTKSGSDDGNFIPGSSTWRTPLTTTIVADWGFAAPPVENFVGFSPLASAAAPFPGALDGAASVGISVLTCWTNGSFGRKSPKEVSFVVRATGDDPPPAGVITPFA